MWDRKMEGNLVGQSGFVPGACRPLRHNRSFGMQLEVVPQHAFGRLLPHLLDFAPTLLSLWNLPLPKHFDGEAWTVAQPDAGEDVSHEDTKDTNG